MNPYILNIEPHDQVHVVTDKIDAAGAEKVLLVFPARRTPLTRRLDLKLIQRHAAIKGVQIALVANRGKLLENATDLGIPVFANIRQAKSASWKTTPPTINTTGLKEEARPTLDWLKANRHINKPEWAGRTFPGKLALGISLAVILALMIITLPSAQIRIQPGTETQQLHMTVSADPSLSSFSLTGDLPAERVTLVVEGREEMQPSGSIMVPLQPASGEVVFTNLSDHVIDIPMGTVVRTAGEKPVRFSTVETAEVEAEAGATVTLPVQALNPGSEGNLAPGEISIVEGDLKLFLTVTNLRSTSGGSAQRSKAPSNADYVALSQRLQESLWQTALAEAASNHPTGGYVIDSAPISMEILEESYDPPEPQPASTLSLQMQVEYEILVVAETDLQAIASGNLDATLPAGTSAYAPSLVILPESEPQFDESGVATWQLYAQRTLYKTIELQELRGQLAGKSKSMAADILDDDLSLTSPPRITLSPPFWPLLPLLPFRINIEPVFE